MFGLLRDRATAAAPRALVRTDTTLAHIRLHGAAQVARPRSMVVMHGMLGNKKNWRSFTRRLLAARPAFEAILVDLRGHGESPSFERPHSVRSCAADVHALLDALGVHADAVVGHSFGGKVALEFLRQQLHRAGPQYAPEHTWVLDSMPMRVPVDIKADDDSVQRVIQQLRTIPNPIPSKQWLTDRITGMGFSRGLALWMTTNVEQVEGGQYRWAFDLDVAHDLFDDYCVQDYVPFLRHEVMAGAESAPPVTLVRAARNAHWSQQRLRELHPQLNEVEEDQRVGAFRVVRLPDAGHWVHIDNPAGLADLMLPSLALD